jgi:hypothetical protein
LTAKRSGAPKRSRSELAGKGILKIGKRHP